MCRPEMARRGIAADQAPAPAKCRVSPRGSWRRGAAPEVADDSLKHSPAAPGALCNWVRIPGEKASLVAVVQPGSVSAGLVRWVRTGSLLLTAGPRRSIPGHGGV